MFCSHCGAENPDGNKYCSSCGGDLIGGGVTNLSTAAGANLGFAEAVNKVLHNNGLDALRDSARFRGFMADECDPDTPEFKVFDRNCSDDLLKPFMDAVHAGTHSEMERAVKLAEHYLEVSNAENPITSRNIAAGIGAAVSSCMDPTNGTGSFNATHGNTEANKTVFISNRAESPASDTIESYPSPKRHGKAAIIAVIAVALSALLGIGAYFLFAKTMPDPDPDPDPAKATQEVVVSFDAGGAETGAMTPLICHMGDSIAVPKSGFSHTGYSFIGWKDEGGNTHQPGDTITLKSDIMLTATWSADACTIKFLGAGADGGATSSLNAEYGSSVTLPKCNYYRNGYEFDCWIDESGNTYDPGDSLIVSGNMSMVAQWKSSAENTPASDGSGDQVSTPSSTSLNASTFARSWEGTYEGYTTHSSDGVIDRSVSISFTRVEANGSLEGTCYIGVDDQTAGATHGIYKVVGNIDWQSGSIRLEGTEWVDQGGLIGMGGFKGTVSPSGLSIGGQWYDPEGEANDGAWSMWAL